MTIELERGVHPLHVLEQVISELGSVAAPLAKPLFTVPRLVHFDHERLCVFWNKEEKQRLVRRIRIYFVLALHFSFETAGNRILHHEPDLLGGVPHVVPIDTMRFQIVLMLESSVTFDARERPRGRVPSLDVLLHQRLVSGFVTAPLQSNFIPSGA